MRKVKLSSPLTEEDICDLTIGDVVFLSGVVYQMMGPAHKSDGLC